jgi:hypothetical protein
VGCASRPSECHRFGTLDEIRLYRKWNARKGVFSCSQNFSQKDRDF